MELKGGIYFLIGIISNERGVSKLKYSVLTYVLLFEFLAKGPGHTLYSFQQI
jgi:hypothetical protein